MSNRSQLKIRNYPINSMTDLVDKFVEMNKINFLLDFLNGTIDLAFDDLNSAEALIKKMYIPYKKDKYQDTIVFRISNFHCLKISLITSLNSFYLLPKGVIKKLITLFDNTFTDDSGMPNFEFLFFFALSLSNDIYYFIIDDERIYLSLQEVIDQDDSSIGEYIRINFSKHVADCLSKSYSVGKNVTEMSQKEVVLLKELESQTIFRKKNISINFNGSGELSDYETTGISEDLNQFKELQQMLENGEISFKKHKGKKKHIVIKTKKRFE